MPPTKKNKRNNNNNFQKKVEDKKPKESECDVKQPPGPIFAFYYLSDAGFNGYWPVQRLDDGYRVHSEHYVWVFPYNSIKNPIIISLDMLVYLSSRCNDHKS